jgi:hypothetical protein
LNDANELVQDCDKMIFIRKPSYLYLIFLRPLQEL